METERLLLENPSYRAWWHLARVYHAMEGPLNRLFEEHGITGAQFGVLRCVADAGPGGLMLSDLSRRLMVTCGNITGVVDRLEQAGYLRREREPADRRVTLAQLTPEGRAVHRRVMPAYQALVRESLAGLSTEENEILAGLCEKLHLSLVESGAARSAAAAEKA
jgi:DNA-binding MarR family transcriptional regulator